MPKSDALALIVARLRMLIADHPDDQVPTVTLDRLQEILDGSDDTTPEDPHA
jgi:hypothetical protein